MAHRARSDRHEKIGEAHAGSVPTISFDYFFAKSDGQPGQEGGQNTITALTVVDSHTSLVTCIPFENKLQQDHANREIIKFIQMLGYSEVISARGKVEMDDPGLAVPVTPPREFVMVDSPRSTPAARLHGGGKR